VEADLVGVNLSYRFPDEPATDDLAISEKITICQAWEPAAVPMTHGQEPSDAAVP
jgi:hypothetical protein